MKYLSLLLPNKRPLPGSHREVFSFLWLFCAFGFLILCDKLDPGKVLLIFQVLCSFYSKINIWFLLLNIEDLCCISFLSEHLSACNTVCVCVCEWVLGYVQIFLTSVDSSLLGCSVHGVFQIRILEWADISSSRESSWFRDQTPVYCIGRQLLFNLAFFTLIETTYVF